jgi:hypothetical protein
MRNLTPIENKTPDTDIDAGIFIPNQCRTPHQRQNSHNRCSPFPARDPHWLDPDPDPKPIPATQTRTPMYFIPPRTPLFPIPFYHPQNHTLLFPYRPRSGSGSRQSESPAGEKLHRPYRGLIHASISFRSY